jgi:hypothetical protein
MTAHLPRVCVLFIKETKGVVFINYKLRSEERKRQYPAKEKGDRQ